LQKANTDAVMSFTSADTEQWNHRWLPNNDCTSYINTSPILAPLNFESAGLLSDKAIRLSAHGGISQHTCKCG